MSLVGSTRSGTAAAAALTQISGLKPVCASKAPSHGILDGILAFPLPQLKVQLDAANSDELRTLHAYIGFGNFATKETNKTIICKHLEKIREWYV